MWEMRISIRYLWKLFSEWFSLSLQIGTKLLKIGAAITNKLVHNSYDIFQHLPLTTAHHPTPHTSHTHTHTHTHTHFITWIAEAYSELCSRSKKLFAKIFRSVLNHNPCILYIVRRFGRRLQPIFRQFVNLINHNTVQRYSRWNTSNHVLSEEKKQKTDQY